MTLKELLDELLSKSTYGIHLGDQVVIDTGDEWYRIVSVDRGTNDGVDVVRIEVEVDQ